MMKRFLLTFVLAFSAFSANAVADEKVLCASPTASAEAMEKDYQALRALGYEVKEGSQFVQESVIAYVGIGLNIAMDTKGVIAVGAVPGSPADNSGLFEEGLGYGIQAVDGISTTGKSIDDVMSMIRGDGIAGKGVVVTFNLRSSDQNFDQFLERKLIKTTIEISCIGMVLTKK
jgi:C-terminal processing protease CtpA/Prc